MPSICPLNLLSLNSINLGWRAGSFTGKRDFFVWNKCFVQFRKIPPPIIPLTALFFSFPSCRQCFCNSIGRRHLISFFFGFCFFLFLGILCIGARIGIDIRKKRKWKECRTKGDTIQEGIKFSFILHDSFSLSPQWGVMSQNVKAGC